MSGHLNPSRDDVRERVREASRASRDILFPDMTCTVEPFIEKGLTA